MPAVPGFLELAKPNMANNRPSRAGSLLLTKIFKKIWMHKNLGINNLGSKLTETIAVDHCPTCAQPIQDTLLAQRVGTEVMPIEENIEYIRSQRSIFLRLKERTEKTISDIESQLVTATSEVNEISARLRALQSDLVAPSNSPSIAVIEERLRLGDFGCRR